MQVWRGAFVLVALAIFLLLTSLNLRTDQTDEKLLGDGKLRSVSQPISYDGVSTIVEGRDVVMPAKVGTVKAILIVLGACERTALNFWPPSATCPNCKGMPEETLIVRRALEEGVLPVALSSTEKCWDVASGDLTVSKDRGRLNTVINETLTKYGDEGTPVYIFGAKSGGHFAVALPYSKRVTGLIVQNAFGKRKRMLSGKMPWGDHPRTVFIGMFNAELLRVKIAENVALLRGQNIDTAEFWVEPFPISETYFSDRDTLIPENISRRVYSILTSAGIIDSDGFITTDPKTDKGWRQHLLQYAPDIANDYDFFSSQSRISELLKLAYGDAEITAEYVREALLYLQSL